MKRLDKIRRRIVGMKRLDKIRRIVGVKRLGKIRRIVG